MKTFALTHILASKILSETYHIETRHVMGISDNNQVDVTEAFNYLQCHVLLTYLLKMRDNPINNT